MVASTFAVKSQASKKLHLSRINTELSYSFKDKNKLHRYEQKLM